jgi:sugar lactone lactonase YvrE
MVFGLAVSTLIVGACGGEGSTPCTDAASGTACRWAGTGEKGFNVETPHANRLDSRLYYPTDLTFGPDGRAYIADWNNHRIRRVEKNDSLTVVLGTDYEGDGSPEMEDRLPECNPAGALGTDVAMNHPTDMKFGPDGLLYVAAWHNNKIRVIDTETDDVTTLTGNGYGYSGDGGLACQALFNQPKTLTFGPDGTLYTIDQRNVRIRAIKMGSDRTIYPVAGSGRQGNLGDGGQALDAEFGFETVATPRPSGALAIVDNKLYVADSMNHRIRRIDLATGIIDCIAGSESQPGYSGDGGPALTARLNFPVDLEVGPDGRLYVADRYNHAIRAIDLTTGIIETVAGNGTICYGQQECLDNAPALEMAMNEPNGISFDGAGNLYIVDTQNSRILKVVR